MGHGIKVSPRGTLESGAKSVCVEFDSVNIHGVAYRGTVYIHDLGAGFDYRNGDHAYIYRIGSVNDKPTDAGRRGAIIYATSEARAYADKNPRAWAEHDHQQKLDEIKRINAKLAKLRAEAATLERERSALAAELKLAMDEAEKLAW